MRTVGIGPAALILAGSMLVAAAGGAWIEKGWESSNDPVTSVAELKRLKTEEAFRGMTYRDSRGHPTIGWGTKEPITKAEGAWLLETRLADTRARLAEAWAPYLELNQARQGALLDMAYELGVEGLLGFHDMLAALERGNWAAASTAALASVWATEVPIRAIVIAAALENG